MYSEIVLHELNWKWSLQMMLDTMFDDWDSGKLEVPGEGSSCGELINLNAIMPFSNKAIHMDGMKYRDAVIEVEIRE